MWVIASLWLKDYFVSYEQLLLVFLCFIGFFLHQCVIHRPILSIRIMCQSIHGNLTLPSLCNPYTVLFYLALLTMLLYWAFFQDRLCVGIMGLYNNIIHTCVDSKYTHSSLFQLEKKPLKPFYPHTIIGSDTASWGDGVLGTLQMIIF